jgi:hypothetical protein
MTNNKPKIVRILQKEYFLPGVYRIECTATNRALFKEAQITWLEMRGYLDDLADGICYDNPEILTDFKKYGPQSFICDFVVYGREYIDSNKRKTALKEAKKSWPGQLY